MIVTSTRPHAPWELLCVCVMASQATLRELWLQGPEDRLCGREQEHQYKSCEAQP